jgi:hypothetical protein
VPWLSRRQVSRRRLAAEARAGFVADEVAMGQVFLRDIRLTPVNYQDTVALHSHISSGGWTIGPLEAAVQRQKSHVIDMNNYNSLIEKYLK